MESDLIDERIAELATDGHAVASAWLLGVVAITLLLAVAVPLLAG